MMYMMSGTKLPFHCRITSGDIKSLTAIIFHNGHLNQSAGSNTNVKKLRSLEINLIIILLKIYNSVKDVDRLF